MMNFPWGSSMMGQGYGSAFPVWFTFLPLLMIWSLVWKGLALWHAARREEKAWFIVLLILNTVGILELVYLVFIVKFFSQKKETPKRKK